MTLPSLALCYHAVSPTWPTALAVAPDQFEQQLALLARRGMRGVRFTDLATGPQPRGMVAITFDDAYRSVLELARPALDRLGWPATVFVPTAFPADGRPMSWPGIDHWMGSEHEDELRPMSWGELEELAAAGWEIGSHTQTHPRLTELDDPALAEELWRSREAVEARLGACPSIAFPYGDVDERVVAATRDAGYAAGAALGQRPRPSAHDASRVGVWRADSPTRFRLKVSSAGRRLSALPLPRRGVER